MKKSTIVFSSVNILTMLCFLGFVWSARNLALIEERDSYDFGDSAGFLLMVAPVLLLCLVVDIVWAAMAFLPIFRRRGYQAAVACMMVLGLWTAVILVARELAGFPSDPALQRTASPPVERIR